MIRQSCGRDILMPPGSGSSYSKSRVLTTGTSVVCRRGNDHCGGYRFPRDNKRNLVVRLRVQQRQVAGPACANVQEFCGYCFLLTGGYLPSLVPAPCADEHQVRHVDRLTSVNSGCSSDRSSPTACASFQAMGSRFISGGCRKTQTHDDHCWWRCLPSDSRASVGSVFGAAGRGRGRAEAPPATTPGGMRAALSVSVAVDRFPRPAASVIARAATAAGESGGTTRSSSRSSP